VFFSVVIIIIVPKEFTFLELCQFYVLNSWRKLLELVFLQSETPCHITVDLLSFFKPPPPVGTGGGYMFSGRPSVPLSVRLSVRP